MSQNLISGIKITESEAAVVAGTSAQNGAEIDMAGYEGVLWIYKFGTAAANNTIHAEQDTVTGMGSAADLEGTSVGVGSSDEIVWLDLYRPQERFVRAVADRGTSTTIEWGVAIQYGARHQPVDNTVAGTIHGEAHASPDEGTK